MSGSSPTISILTSGVGLGTYVPALLNQRVLRRAGRTVDVEVIEGYFTAEARLRHLEHRAAYQQNFELALIARRMTKDVTGALDSDRIDALIDRWVRQEQSRFVVWSGFWLSVVRRYVALVPHVRVEVDLCRIDAVVSPSFRIQQRLVGAECRDIWLWNWTERRLDWQITVTAQPPLALSDRDRRLVVHGGGWGLGTYADVLPELSAAGGYAVDVIAPEVRDWPGRRPTDRRFTPEPDWYPWQRDMAGELAFPPLCEFVPGRPGRRLRSDLLPPAHSLVRNAVAIVSKPGGGTMIDSLAAATPVVLLKPCGEAEARNGDLWEQLGFGIRFDHWRRTGFDFAQLAELQSNLVSARTEGRMYPSELDRICA